MGFVRETQDIHNPEINMTEAVALAAVAAAPALAAAVTDENTLMYTVPGTDPAVQMTLNLSSIPAAVRLDFLKSKVNDYVQNAVNQANMRHKKLLAPFEAYEAACAADPLQTAVAKPEGERPVLDLIPTATAARDRLYSGEIRKMSGEPKARKTVDPLVKLVTDAVVRELFDKTKLTNPAYKWTDAVIEVGGNGVEYLNAKIEAMVAAGGDRAALEKFRDSRYIQPVEIMLGRKVSKANEGVSLL